MHFARTDNKTSQLFKLLHPFCPNYLKVKIGDQGKWPQQFTYNLSSLLKSSCTVSPAPAPVCSVISVPLGAGVGSLVRSNLSIQSQVCFNSSSFCFSPDWQNIVRIYIYIQNRYV